MIDVKKFIEKHGLSKQEVERQLFPTHTYPDHAMNRVYKGEQLLDSDQISRLAAIAGTTVNKVFDNDWEASAVKDLIVMELDGFRAELDTKTWITRIFHNDSLFHEEVLSSPKLPMGEYIEFLNYRIAAHVIT